MAKRFVSLTARQWPKSKMGTVVDDLMAADPITVDQSNYLERVIDLM